MWLEAEADAHLFEAIQSHSSISPNRMDEFNVRLKSLWQVQSFSLIHGAVNQRFRGI